jgi:SSS family solute:Na+ symporter
MTDKLDILLVFSPIDWIVFGVVLALTIAAVAFGWFRREKGLSESESFLDLLLMGRKLSLPLFVATLVATWYGGIFGVTQIAFEKGIYNFLTQGVFWYATYLIFAVFLVHRIRKYKALTLPDLVGEMFGPLSRRLAAVFNFLNVVPVAYVISLGLLVKICFGFDILTGSLIGVCFVLTYSLFGGFRAVVFSDLLQFSVMVSSVMLVLGFSVSTYGGLSFLEATLPSTHFEWFGGEGLLTTFVWGLIALSTLVDPNFYQRCFAAETPKIAKKGILISTCVWIVFDICTTGGALYARAVIPEAESGVAYLIYALQLMPDGLRGLILAGILATILSTIDSYLFVAGTSVTYDLLPKKIGRLVNTNHIGVVCSAGLALVLSVYFEGNIRAVWKTLGSYSAACLLLPLMVGYIFPGKITDRQFFFSSVVGIAAVSIWRNLDRVGIWSEIDEVYIGCMSTGLGLLAFGFFYSLRGRRLASGKAD